MPAKWYGFDGICLEFSLLLLQINWVGVYECFLLFAHCELHFLYNILCANPCAGSGMIFKLVLAWFSRLFWLGFRVDSSVAFAIVLAWFVCWL